MTAREDQPRCEKCFFLGVPCAGKGVCGCSCHEKTSSHDYPTPYPRLGYHPTPCSSNQCPTCGSRGDSLKFCPTCKSSEAQGAAPHTPDWKSLYEFVCKELAQARLATAAQPPQDARTRLDSAKGNIICPKCYNIVQVTLAEQVRAEYSQGLSDGRTRSTPSPDPNWLDTELWNFAHALVLNLGLEDKKGPWDDQLDGALKSAGLEPVTVPKSPTAEEKIHHTMRSACIVYSNAQTPSPDPPDDHSSLTDMIAKHGWGIDEVEDVRKYASSSNAALEQERDHFAKQNLEWANCSARHATENAGLRKRIHHLENHNQYFFRCESAWCNPAEDYNPALEMVKGAVERAEAAESKLKDAANEIHMLERAAESHKYTVADLVAERDGLREALRDATENLNSAVRQYRHAVHGKDCHCSNCSKLLKILVSDNYKLAGG